MKYDGEAEFEAEITRADDSGEEKVIKLSVTVYGDCQEADPDVGYNHAQWDAQKYEATDEDGNKVKLSYEEEESLREQAEEALQQQAENDDANMEEDSHYDDDDY